MKLTQNREIAEYMFDKMREFGFKPYDIEYGNGYFLFDMGEDSVVHFRLKGVWKHWKFGMWVHSDYLSEDYRKEYEEKYGESKWNVVEVFCQHDHYIDKFKPSASDILVQFDLDDWKSIKEDKTFVWFNLEKMFGMIKKHPLLCYCGYCGKYVGYRSQSFLKEFLYYEGKWYAKHIHKAIVTTFWREYTKLKIFFAKRSKCIKEIEFHDFEKENPGWSTSHLYSVIPIFTKDSSEEEQCKWMNRWFKKEKYGKYDYYDYVVEVLECKIEGSDKIYTFV